MQIISFLIGLHEQAPEEVRLAGDLALLCGVAGLCLSIYFAFVEWRRNRDAMAAYSNSSEATWPKSLSVLGVFGDASRATTLLSPDAVWEAVATRLHDNTEAKMSVLRFLAYAPLLIGLCGTIIGLSELVPRLGLEMENSTRQGLQGVFIGTLFGIIGSLIAALGTLVFPWVSARSVRAVEALVHDRLLPAIPERRVGVKIDEAIAALIAERTQSVVETFRTSLMPLASSLQASARESTLAATQSTAAFAQAVTVLREAGNIEKAARTIATKLEKVRGAAEAMREAAAVSRESANIEAGVRTHLISAATTVQEAAAVLGKGVTASDDALRAHIGGMAASTDRLQLSIADLHGQISGIRSAFDGLAAGVIKRNSIEEQRLKEAERQVTGLVAPVAGLARGVSETTQELAALRQVLELFGTTAGDQIRAELARQFSAVASKLEGAVGHLGGVLPQGAAELRLAAANLNQAVADLNGRVPEVEKTVHPLDLALRQYVDHLDRIHAQLAALAESPPATVTLPDYGALVEALHGVEREVGNLRTAIPAAATPPAKESRTWRIFRRRRAA